MAMELNTFDVSGATEALASSDAVDVVNDLTDRIANDARSNAPQGTTGMAQRSIDSLPATVADGVATGIVYSDDPFWHLIEYGSVNNDPYRPISRAAMDNAGEFTDAGV